MLRGKPAAVAVMIGIGGLGAAGLAAAAPASAGAHASAAWHIAKTVPGPNFPIFTAAAAASGTSAWAFEAPGGNAKPRAYQLSGRTWKLRSFPGKQDEQIFAASAPSSSNVWAFTTLNGSTSRVLRFDGNGWRQVKAFGEVINSGLALSPTNVWVFGAAFGPSLGAVHYNGHTWTKSARGLLGASALSARSIWAYGKSSVAHWNGSTWRSTSVGRLLPKGNQVCGPGLLAGIDALSARDVFAVAKGGCPDGEGPLVLLHYNGSRWSKVAPSKHINADPVGLIDDGMGGLWIPLASGAPASGLMEHYAHGKLSQVKLPISEQHIELIGAAIGQRTTAALAFGLSRKSFTASTSTAVILRYGT
jgi:hypothetical protein